MRTDYLRGSLEWVLMVALVFGTGLIAQAQQDASQPEGRIVEIGPADSSPTPQPSVEEAPALPPPEADSAEQEPSAPQYWIGILGVPLPPPLRAQLDIPDDQGLMVRDIVPESPAAKAGVKKYDVLLRANDTDLSDIGDLADVVNTAGEQKGQISLELLRRGQRETVSIMPAERPEGVELQRRFGPHGMPGGPRQFLHGFHGDRPFEFRSFGPGVIVGGPGAARLPDGVSVAISKQGDEPAHITVKRGDETWEVVGDDRESLDRLPDDIRPVVERMLHGMAMSDVVLPNVPMPHPFSEGDGRLRERLDEMEKQLHELRERLRGPEGEPSPGSTQDQQ